MGFPIAIGAKSVSSRAVAPPEPVEEFSCDGRTTLHPVIVVPTSTNTTLLASTTIPSTVVTATTEQLQAVVTLSYYDMVCHRNYDDDDAADADAVGPAVVEYCTAELRVQLSPSSEPCSSHMYRDALHRIPLPPVSAPQSSSSSPIIIAPQVVISSDQRFLTCLIPHPHNLQNSVVVVFQLRRPVVKPTTQHRIKPPLPSYIQPSTYAPKTMPTTVVATKPRLLHWSPLSTSINFDDDNNNDNDSSRNPQLQPLLDATCLCDVAINQNIVPHSNDDNGDAKLLSSSSSLLLVGTRDGCIRAASYRPLMLVEFPLHDFSDIAEDSSDTASGTAIENIDTHSASQIQQSSPSPESEATTIPTRHHHSSSSLSSCCFPTAMQHLTEWNNNHDGSIVGRLAVVLDDGTVSVFRSHLQLARDRTELLEYHAGSSSEHGRTNSNNNNNIGGGDAYSERSAAVAMHGDGGSTTFSKSSVSHNQHPVHLQHPQQHHYHQQQRQHPQQQKHLKHAAAVRIHLTETHQLQTAVHHDDGDAVCWVAGTYLALAQRPNNNNNAKSCTVQVYGLYDAGRSLAVATLHMTWDRLRENAHTTFVAGCGGSHHQSPRDNPSIGNRNKIPAPRLALDYDPVSDSIAVSAFLWRKTQTGADQDESTSLPSLLLALPFVCVWSWRTNAQGFTAMASHFDTLPVCDNRLPSPTFSTQYCLSRLCFARDWQNRRSLVHFFAAAAAVSADPSHSQQLLLRKEVYGMAILSPPHDHRQQQRRASLQPPNTLLLSSTSVSYPTASRTSPCLGGSSSMELRWTESVIPTSYLAAFGAPQVAAMGQRSVAVASSRGLCLLDGAGAERSRMMTMPIMSAATATTTTMVVLPTTTSDSHTTTNDVLSTTSRDNDKVAKFLRRGHVHPRWTMFSNEVDERRFRVISMAWWEGSDVAATANAAMNNSLFDDVLVAVIQVFENKKDGNGRGCYYLSCWPSSNIDLKSQLLCPAGAQQFRNAKEFQWGTRLPDSFTPATINLLQIPTTKSMKRKAVVLVVDASYETSFLVYQLQVYGTLVETSSAADARQQNYSVLSRCGATGTIGSPVANLFLAGVSATFDLVDESCDTLHQKGPHSSFIATIGVIRLYGAGLDALSVSRSGVIAAGQVIKSADSDSGEPLDAELASFWLADMVYDMEVSFDGTALDFFVWVLQLASGRLLCWSVPVALTEMKLHSMTLPTTALYIRAGDSKSRPVHPKGIILGTVCEAGSTSSWMQRSAHGARTDFLAGFVPRSSFGCVIGVAQNCRKLHRSLGEAFEGELFRPDFLDHELMCPSDFALYPPGCLASLYTLVYESVLASIRCRREFDYFNQHVRRRMKSPELQNTTIVSFELLIIRAVEKITGLRGARQMTDTTTLATAQGILSSLVAALRKLTTPLQFTSLFMKIGRQIEPSCLPHLFPLPFSPDQVTGGETLDDLFDEFLASGSITLAVAALPLLANNETTARMCAATFHHCLNEFDASFGSRQRMGLHGQAHEGRDAAADVFRYAIKLFQPSTGDQDPNADNADNDEHEHDHDHDEHQNQRSYSIMCGMGRFFRRKSDTNTEKASPRLVNGVNGSVEHVRGSISQNSLRLLSWHCYKDENFHSVGAVMARYILTCMFGDTNAFPTKKSPKRLGTLAVLLMGDEQIGWRPCSTARFNKLVQETKPAKFSRLLPISVRRSGGLVKFLKQVSHDYTRETDPALAGTIFDLVLLLLGTESNDFEADIPGLLLVAIITGQASDRISDIMIDDNIHSYLWMSYIQAHRELLAEKVNE